MDEKLEMYLRNYIVSVDDICMYILKEMNLNNKKDLMEYRFSDNKMEHYIGKLYVCFHGRGCVVKNNEYFYDWDFGYGSRWCGINPFLVETTMKNNGSKEYDYKEIKQQCENATRVGLMYKKYDLYYFSILESELMTPEFPKEFDVLLVEYFGEKYILKRNKMVDRFLRKSNKVYKNIENYYDKYTLRFMLKDKEVYSFYYSDFGYPEKAIELMQNILIEYRKKNII